MKSDPEKPPSSNGQPTPNSPSPSRQSLDGKKVRPPRRPVTLGPVDNLEEYVRSDWWRQIFNSLYLMTDGDVVNDQRITEQEITLFSRILDLKPELHILDLCCGQGRHTLELARRGLNNVEGLDRSHFLITRARTQARKEGLDVRFREGDARKLPYPADSFDVVMILGNSFGYFETMQDDLRVLKEVFRVLKPGGRLFMDVADGAWLRANFSPRSWEWIDKNHFVCRERSLSADRHCLISREIITHVEKGVVEDRFYSERLYSQDEMTDLLRRAEFSDIVFHGEISPDSQRNQDLGMMERRLLVSSTVNKEWSAPRRRARTSEKHIAVVMGDPSRPDVIKPGATFDDDDLETIRRLKQALAAQDGMRFTYFSNHQTLISDLMRLRGKVDMVLNLCDEGFNNRARLELHVPAILEMLDIPYTGGGPQCLAFCYDKSLVRGVAKEMNIPVPDAFFIKPEDTTFDLPFSFPVIVKPNYGDSSFGITMRSVCYRVEDLAAAIAEIREKFGYEHPILVEQFLTGKDITVGIIGNPPESYHVFPIIEEDYSDLPPELPRICGYEAKWMPDSPYWKALKSIPANLPEPTERFVVECCRKLFERLECRDYARFDWRLDAQGTPRLLEVNPNPGWCWDGHLAKMAKLDGISYSQMLGMILDAAFQREKLAEERGERPARPAAAAVTNGQNGCSSEQAEEVGASQQADAAGEA
ncbi:MAG: methyltransferase domain-containing protein [Candidatus Sumerlaeia bacterium]